MGDVMETMTDTTTGEPTLVSEVFLVHCDRELTPLGVWRITESEQVPMYPSSTQGQVDQEAAEITFGCYKGSQATWASVVERLVYSTDVSTRWVLLDNDADVSLRQMFTDLNIR